MRLYLDTSALVKLYVEEDGSPRVRRWVENATTVATSIIAYVEARAAFARRRRERKIPSAEYTQIVRDLDSDWSHYIVLEATEPLVRSAAELAEVYALRAYDAIHLASARVLNDRLAEAVTFASWDKRLTLAARDDGLDVPRRER